MQRLVKVITADPEEIRKAVEALQQAEAELTGQ
jgi:predicted Fe-Mo cluster-binding NifX family protein